MNKELRERRKAKKDNVKSDLEVIIKSSQGVKKFLSSLRVPHLMKIIKIKNKSVKLKQS